MNNTLGRAFGMYLLEGGMSNRNTVQQEGALFLGQQIPSLLAATTAFALVLMVGLWPFVPHNYLLLWLACFFLFSVLRVAYYFRHKTTGQNTTMARSYMRGLFYFSVLSGFLWGSTSFFIFVPDSLVPFILVTLIALSLSLGGAIALASYLPAFWVFSIPFLAPLILILLFGQAPLDYRSQLVVAAILFFGQLGLLLFNRNLNKTFLERTALHQQNLMLIEDLKIQKDTAIKANLDKSRFLAAASHDLRQPLHAMGLFTDNLAAKLNDDDDQKTLGRMNQCLDTLGEMFSALLDISKLDAGVVDVSPQHFKLAPLLSQIIGCTASKGWGSRLRTRYQDVTLYANQVAISRIVQNLVTNALKHNPEADVLLATRQRGDAVEIQVWDSGSGIPAAEQENIFGEFYQLNNPQRDAGKGLGLGLAIVKRLCTATGCPLKVRSRAGKGSMFSITVPLGDEAAIHNETIVEDLARDRLSGATVLILDNETMILQALNDLLVQWGSTVILAEDVEEACQKFRDSETPVDILVVDYRLSRGSDGIDAINTLREEAGWDIPALLITGETGEIHLREVRASGLPLLHKPVKPAKLRNAMNQLLSH